MAKAKEINYTPEQTKELLEIYQAGMSVEELATRYNRSERSIVAKLTHCGVYRPAGQPTRRPKKSEILKKIGEELNIPLSVLESFEKATHEALTSLLLGIEKLKEDLNCSTLNNPTTTNPEDHCARVK